MTLARLSVLLTSLLAALVLALFLKIFLAEWQNYRTLRAGLVSMELARKALVAAEKLSFERGPANAMIGAGDRSDDDLPVALTKARARSDVTLATLIGQLDGSASQHDRAALPVLRQAALSVMAARQEIDRLIALPRAQRDPAQVRSALQAMFDVIPLLLDAHAMLSVNLSTFHRTVSESMAGARLAAELREYAGQLGSQFTAVLTAGQPLSQAELRSIALLRGRIAQLNELLARPLQASRADDPLRAALHTMQRQYLGAGLGFIAQMEALGRQGSAYGIDTAGFARRYVPEMTSIVELRDALLLDTFNQARHARTDARQQMLVIGSLGGLILLVLVGTGFALQRQVVRPLACAAQDLRDIAAGHLDRQVHVADRADEIGEMQAALSVLRRDLLEKRRLELERQQMIENLERVSRTDPLTGIMNRRAFTEELRTSARRADARHLPIAVVLFDIDHFKSVNDRYGHEAGDRVLVRVAAVARRLLRQGETVARYGGEEFIVLLADTDPAGALQAAERLRCGIEAAVIPLEDGQKVQVTASFGVAAAENALVDLKHLLRVADAALYAAKDQGRNRTVTASTLMPSASG